MKTIMTLIVIAFISTVIINGPKGESVICTTSGSTTICN